MFRKILVEFAAPILKCKKAGDVLFIILGKQIAKVDAESGRVIQSNAVFPQDSRTRDLVIDEDVIYCEDFYRLHKVDLATLEVVQTWALGSDLRSDVCSVGFDDSKIYASIRNGAFAVIDKASDAVKKYPVSQTSIWEMIISDYIYAGNVAGELLVIDKKRISVVKSKAVHRKNLKSLLLDGDLIYTASQDLSIAKIDRKTLDVILTKKRCHRKMFYLAGIWENCLVTVSPPCNEMKVWDKNELTLIKEISGGTWGAFTDGGLLYEIIDNRIVCSRVADLVD
ncbi:MAG: hypothetical protein GX228_02345 [Firmicutes bacterium]|nr:hypothetical protein [Bacillota bacterium]